MAGAREGAGFFIEPGVVLTAAHVVRDAPTIQAFVYGDGEPYSARLLGYDEVLDLAALRVEGAPAEAVLRLSDTSPQPGSELWTVGHPDGEPWSITRGLLSSKASGHRLHLSLPVSPGSSGGPLLVLEGGIVKVAGLISRTKANPTRSVAVSAEAIKTRLPDLIGGVRQGWTDPQAFIALAPQRGPLVHQVIVAKHVHGQAPSDHIEGITDTLTFTQFPAPTTLHAWTTWRHFFEGQHTYRYRVVTLSPLRDVHVGPERVFSLSNPEDSFVHQAQINVSFDAPGLYALVVETDGAPSRVYPLKVLGPQAQPEPEPEPDFASEQRPIVHAMLLAGDVQGIPQPDGSVSVSVERTFNEYRPASWPAPALRFKTWVRWGYGFAGEHTFQIQIVDAAGDLVTQSAQEPFSLADAMSSYQLSMGWEVQFDAPGLYFVLCLTDGAITRALPLWVR